MCSITSTTGILFPVSKTSTHTFPQWSLTPSIVQTDSMCSLHFFLGYQRTLFCNNWQKTQSQALHHQPQWELCKSSAEKGNDLKNELRVKSPKPLTCYLTIICSHLKCRFLKPSPRGSYLEGFAQGLGIIILTAILQGILLQIRFYKTQIYFHEYSQPIFEKGAKAI